MNVIFFYNKFKSLWDELYGTDDVTCGRTCAAATHIRACVEVDKTHDFLMGLDDELYGQIHTQILGMDPFPVLNKAFSMVTQEERHKSIVHSRDDKTEALSFAVQTSNQASTPRFSPTVPSSLCTYCGKMGHHYDHCYQMDRNTKKVIGLGEFRNGVYMFRQVSTLAFASPASSATHADSLLLLHQRLGHPSNNILSFVSSSRKHKDAKQIEDCEICLRAKQTRRWKVLDLETRDLFVSRDVKFFENIFPFEHSDQLLSTPYSIMNSSYEWEDELTFDNQSQQTSEEIYEDCSTEIQHVNSHPLAIVEATSDNAEIVDTTTEMDTAPAPTVAPLALAETTQPSRHRLPPSYLSDYICHSASIVHPTHSPPASAPSSGIKFSIENYVVYSKFSKAYCHFIAHLTSNLESRNYKEAVRELGWRNAIKLEINALEKNRSWDIVTLTPGKRVIGCQWVYKTKYKSDSSIERHKERLVVLENHQIEGEDFTDTFSLVAKTASVRMFLVVAVAKNWEVHQLDVNNAFLHGNLHEEVYMKLPPEFTTSSSSQVCRLRKSLYGLRQSPRNWFAKLTLALRKYGFTQSHADHTLFTCRKGEDFLSVLVYVDC
ncbi:transmembrane signal receptor [Lithospermum erythrorhizon]|uniref:Transmembrane signal receptor n=1 Tax=Lithospermum erythrorhizon TaxID=34254 RepID=A0AAV3RYU8_LITER